MKFIDFIIFQSRLISAIHTVVLNAEVVFYAFILIQNFVLLFYAKLAILFNCLITVKADILFLKISSCLKYLSVCNAYIRINVSYICNHEYMYISM